MNRRAFSKVLLGAAVALSAAQVLAGTDVLGDLLKRAAGSGSSGTTGVGSALGGSQLAAGLKEALRIGTERTVERVQVLNGFNLDKNIHIPLPKKLEKARKLLKKAGMSGQLDELELQLNRAAETAAPKAKQLFVSAVSNMTFDDARGILNGPEDAATLYLRRQTQAQIAEQMRPVIDESLARVGAVTTMKSLLASYSSFPLAPKLDTDLTGYVVGKAMDGLFFYVAKEEAAIRKDPVKRTTELLRQVFG